MRHNHLRKGLGCFEMRRHVLPVGKQAACPGEATSRIPSSTPLCPMNTGKKRVAANPGCDLTHGRACIAFVASEPERRGQQCGLMMAGKLPDIFGIERLAAPTNRISKLYLLSGARTPVLGSRCQSTSAVTSSRVMAKVRHSPASSLSAVRRRFSRGAFGASAARWRARPATKLRSARGAAGQACFANRSAAIALRGSDRQIAARFRGLPSPTGASRTRIVLLRAPDGPSQHAPSTTTQPFGPSSRQSQDARLWRDNTGAAFPRCAWRAGARPRPVPLRGVA